MSTFYAFVGSILLYGCEVWGFGKNKEIERIRLKFGKIVLNVNPSTNSADEWWIGEVPIVK